jgi:CheY-like chemotaxis protein
MRNRRILVIDDNPAMHEDFGRILQADTPASGLRDARAALFDDTLHETPHEAFEVEYADQGQAGLGMVQRAKQHNCPDAVAFVDMRMLPGWDGVETLEHLWSVDPDLQAVICTAFADLDWADIIQRCKRCRAESAPDLQPWHCQTCGAFEVEIVSGDELLVDAVELEKGVTIRRRTVPANDLREEHHIEHGRHAAKRHEDEELPCT